MLHPALAPLAFLVGRWEGEGRGVYPTIQPFGYAEVVTVEAMPTPVLAYAQRTRDLATGQPRHAESGWFRLPDGEPELVVAQATGVAEAHRGRLEGQRLDLAASTVGLTASAAGHRITEVRRVLEVDGDVLRYELHMAAAGQPLQLHLAAELRRT